MSMEDDAVDWYDSLPETTKGNYIHLKETFQTHYGGGIQQTVVELSNLPNLKQKLESMVTFGARLKLALNRIDSSMKEEMRLYFFNLHANEKVAREVSHFKPNTLDDAIQYAIYLERIDKTVNAQTNFLNLGPPSAPPGLQQPATTNTNYSPMEVDLNQQQSTKFHPNN